MQKRLSFMVSEELFDAIESARGDVARERWLRRAVEASLAEARFGPGAVGEFGAVERALGEQATSVENPVRRGVPGASGVAGPAPAEQPDPDGAPVPFAGYPLESEADVKRRQRAAGPFREFRPYPKGGKR